MKKYHSVIRHGKKETVPTLDEDDRIVIQEKIDGANASFRRVGEAIWVYSRRYQLSEKETMSGFYDWVHATIDPADLLEGVLYYGEWTTKHRLDYRDNHHQFYLFDVYDVANELYQPFSLVKRIAKDLDLRLAPVFYEGTFVSLEHIESFVGQSELGPVGEGVVVKNYHYIDPYGRQVFSKFLSEQFKEFKIQKKVKAKNAPDALQVFIEQTLTKARVSKHLQKLVDDGRLDPDYAVKDMGEILKKVSPDVYEDIIKEELDVLLKIVKRKVGKNIPNVVKAVLLEEGRM